MSAGPNLIRTDTIGAAAVGSFDLLKTAGALVVTAANTDVAVGIVQDGYAIGATDAAVCLWGCTFARGGAATTQYSVFSPTSTGEVIDFAGSQTRTGIILEAHGAANDEKEVFLFGDKAHTAVG